ncbi:electron transporter SenC [Candidatus Phycosocius spiralis]|uniref:Electron transporter SenC n=1 Tax=Candidatus Phycosocius spiralis TaxID=2815099 RepID=A0ABQ4PU80_9PROT|nr:electron transporter SenC [Candidatus Phycosocius spiralis]
MVIGLVVLGGAFVQRNLAQKAAEASLPKGCNARAFGEIGGPLSLVNQDNVAVTEKSFQGKPALIYFGFTSCPDICPLSLQTMTQALDVAKAVPGSKSEAIQPILISLDPERDTPAVLKAYVASAGFPASLQGLTGTNEQIAAAAKAFKVGYRKSVPEGAKPEDYVIDHTSIFYLMDSKGKLATFFSSDPDPKDMGICIAAISKQGL